jgi:hypothetical protein
MSSIMVQTELAQKIRPRHVGTLERPHKFGYLRIMLDLCFSFRSKSTFGIELYICHHVRTSKGLV